MLRRDMRSNGLLSRMSLDMIRSNDIYPEPVLCLFLLYQMICPAKLNIFDKVQRGMRRLRAPDIHQKKSAKHCCYKLILYLFQIFINQGCRYCACSQSICFWKSSLYVYIILINNICDIFQACKLLCFLFLQTFVSNNTEQCM